MTLAASWSNWRYRAATKIQETAVALSFVAAPPSITRAAGSFVFQGYLDDMTIDIAGSANNDFRYTIDTVAVATLTLVATDAPIAEGPVNVDTLAVNRDVDQVEEYPGLRAAEAGRTNLVRSGGFDTGLAGTPVPYGGASFQVTANGTATDGAPGTDEYDWYLSQRTDVVAKQYLTFAQKAPAGGNTYSGTVTIVHNALATSELGTLTTPSIEQTTELFKHCDLYCKRLSDGAIQWVSLLRTMLGAT